MIKQWKWMVLTVATCTLTWADGATLQAKIAKLQTLPKTERFKLMNEIKRELARMNETQRKEALGKLRASMHGKGKKAGHTKGMHRGTGHRKATHKRMQQHKGMQEHMRENMLQRPMHKQTPNTQNRPHPQVPQNRPGNQHNRR